MKKLIFNGTLTCVAAAVIISCVKLPFPTYIEPSLSINDTAKASDSFAAAEIDGFIPTDEPRAWVSENLYDEADSAMYYDQLDMVEQRMYDIMLEAFDNDRASVRLNNIEKGNYHQRINRVLSALTYDHPELYWIDRSWSSKWWDRDVNDGLFDLEINVGYWDYWDYETDRAGKRAELDRVVKQIADKARQYPTPLEQLQYVHDYIILNNYYDYDGLEEYDRPGHDPQVEHIYSPYGTLINGRSVCAGYAKAFKLIMNELGYGCMYLVGYINGAQENVKHAWNVVYVDGEPYFFDLTHNDSDTSSFSVSYMFYGITSDSVDRKYIADTDFIQPEFTSDSFDYAEQCLEKCADYTVKSYSFETVCEIFEKQRGSDELMLRIDDTMAALDAYDDLIVKGRFREIPEIRESGGNYYHRDVGNGIYVFVKKVS